MQVLPQSFIIAEKKCFVPLDRPSQCASKLVALEWRSRTLIEIIRRIEVVVSQKFVSTAVHLVRSRAGDDQHLGAGSLAVLRAVGVTQHIEFAHSIDAQQFLADTAGLHVVLRSPGKLHAIQQEKILLRAIAGNRKVIAHRGIGYAHPSGLLRRKIDDPGIQRQQLVIAAAVQRQILDLALAD